MPKEGEFNHLTEGEIRQLLRNIHRPRRQKHLESYRQSGRVITLARDIQRENFTPLIYEFESFDDHNSNPTRPRAGLRFMDYVLGFLEFGALIGIITLIWFGWNSLFTLNQRASATWAFSSPTPTAVIRAVVLPDGHTPPNATGGTQPNDGEIPAHLKPVAQVYASLPTPTPAPQHGIRIQIPALNIDAPIFQGDGWEQLMGKFFATWIV
jgi:sortase A